MSLLLLLLLLSWAKAGCIWYEECGTNPETYMKINCHYTGDASKGKPNV